MAKKPKSKKEPTKTEDYIALIIRAVTAIAALIDAIRWW